MLHTMFKYIISANKISVLLLKNNNDASALLLFCLQENDSMKKCYLIKYVFVGVLSLSIIEYSIATVDQ